MTAILLVHGLSATNKIWDNVLLTLEKKNFRVFNPMLPGHGISPEHLKNTSYNDMVAFLKEYTAPIIKQHKKILIIAESFGTNIALDAIPKKYIQAMVCIGTAVKIRNAFLLSLLANLIKFLRPNYFYKKAEMHPRVKKGTTYDRLHVNTVAMFFRENWKLKYKLKKCMFPMMFIYSKNDSLIDTEFKKKFLSNHKNDKIEVIEYDTDTHAILETKYSKNITEKIIGFLEMNGKVISMVE